jgi:hypothetical protein
MLQILNLQDTPKTGREEGQRGTQKELKNQSLRPRSETSRSLDAGGIPLRFNGAAPDTQDQVESYPQNNMRQKLIRIGPRPG